MEIGIDLIEIHRIEQALQRTPNFAKNILSVEEFKIFEAYPYSRRLDYLAGRFAAKEAYSKAIGTGIGRIRFTDIEILNDRMGRPYINQGPLHHCVKLSISHSLNYATAMVIIDLDQEAIHQAYHEFINDK